MPGLLSSFRAMMARVKPDRVVCGAFEQGHLDHDATHWLVTHSFDGPVFERRSTTSTPGGSRR